MGVKLSPVTGGPIVDESLNTNIPGVFACGNVLHVHDLVDYVSEEATLAGKFAAEYIKEGERPINGPEFKIETGKGVRYTVPVTVHPDRAPELTTVRFRVGNVYKDPEICVYMGDKCVLRRKKQICAPGEMEQVIIKKADLKNLKDGEKIVVCLENVL